MKKNIFILLVSLIIISCHDSDVTNTYTISGNVGNVILVTFLPNNDIQFDTLKFAVNLISDDKIIGTSDDGIFTFSGLEEGKSYMVIPQSLSTEGNGMTPLDLVLIRKYIEGTEVFDAFQRLAADVNMDGLVDSTDLELFGNCLLDNKQCFNWRFATDDYDGSGNGQADQFVINKLNADVTIHFIPINTGDITGTHNP